MAIANAANSVICTIATSWCYLSHRVYCYQALKRLNKRNFFRAVTECVGPDPYADSDPSETQQTRDSVDETVSSVARLLAASPDLITSFDCLVPVTTEVMAKSTAFFGDTALHRAASFCAYDGARLLLVVSFGITGDQVL